MVEVGVIFIVPIVLVYCSSGMKEFLQVIYTVYYIIEIGNLQEVCWNWFPISREAFPKAKIGLLTIT